MLLDLQEQRAGTAHAILHFIADCGLYLGRFERVVGWKVYLDHEDSLCIGAVWRPAEEIQLAQVKRQGVSEAVHQTHIRSITNQNSDSDKQSIPHDGGLPMEEFIWRCRSCTADYTPPNELSCHLVVV